MNSLGSENWEAISLSPSSEFSRWSMRLLTNYDSLSGPVNVEVNVNCNLIWEYGFT